MKLRNKISLLPVFIFFGCQAVVGELCPSDSNYTTIKEGKVVSVDISPEEYYIARNSYSISENGQDYLLRSFHQGEFIEVWDWQKKELIKKMPLANSGPNQVQGIMAGSFYPISMDTLLLPSILGRLYFQKNDSIINVNRLEEYNFNMGFSAMAQNKVHRFQNDLILYQNLPFAHPASESSWKSYTPFISYNYNTEALEELPIYYPDYFYRKCWSFIQDNVSFTKFENELVYVFGVGEEIYRYDMASKQQNETVFCATSKFVKFTPDPINCNITNDNAKALQMKKSPASFAIEYDPYKNIFYKIILHPASEEDALSNESWDLVMPFSIMVLDTDFKVIDEIILPAKTYFFRDFFVTEEGLWISKNNPYDSSFSEDKIQYALFLIQ